MIRRLERFELDRSAPPLSEEVLALREKIRKEIEEIARQQGQRLIGGPNLRTQIEELCQAENPDQQRLIRVSRNTRSSR